MKPDKRGENGRWEVGLSGQVILRDNENEPCYYLGEYLSRQKKQHTKHAGMFEWWQETYCDWNILKEKESDRKWLTKAKLCRAS